MRREGRHLSVRAGQDEVYRVTQKEGGHWLWCDLYGNQGGDNIDLVREIEGNVGYADAVYKLIGNLTVIQKPRLILPKRQPPQLPVQTRDAIESGRNYLMHRGISLETLEHAEKSGMLRYSEGGVLFVGYDKAGIAQNVTRRAILASDPIQKRDLRGSDKSYPPILTGNSSSIWIVEGGVDALALHDLYRKWRAQRLPTAIVSGGSGILSFLERDFIQIMLRGAEEIVVAYENERNPETQARTDAQHDKQAARISAIVGREVIKWRPDGFKDLAEMNLFLQEEDEEYYMRDGE